MASAKRKRDLEDDNNGDQQHEQRAVFIDTSLNTHLVILVSHDDTFSILKQKILTEHSKCFPDFGEIIINALKVKRKGCYYHLLDSMLVRTAFHGVAKNWFLFADASSPVGSAQRTVIDHAIIPASTYKTPATRERSSKHLRSKNVCNKGDRSGTYSYNIEKMSQHEKPKRFDLSRDDDECKSVDDSLELGGSGGKSHDGLTRKRRKKKHHDGLNENGATSLSCTGYMRQTKHIVPKTNPQLQQLGVQRYVDNSPFIGHPSGDGNVQRPGLPGMHNTIAADDHGKTFLHGHKNMLDPEIQKDLHFNKGKEPPQNDSHMRNVGNDTKSKKIVNDEALLSSPIADGKHKVVNESEDAQEMSLLETKSLISDSDRAQTNRSLVEDMQKSRVVDMNGLPSEALQTSAATRKRKLEEKNLDCEFANPEINAKENLKDTENFSQNASSIATIAPKLESVQVSQPLAVHLEDSSNNLFKDVQEEAHRLEGTGTTTGSGLDNQNGIDNVGLGRGSGARKIKKSKKRNVSHPTTSIEAPDILKDGVAPSQIENTIHINAEADSFNNAEAGTSVQLKDDSDLLSQHGTLASLEREKETENDIAPLKSLDMKGILDSGKTPKKRKTSKAKNPATEKQEFSVTDNHQDLDNHTVSKGSAEYQNKDGPTNEGHSGENVPQIKGAKGTNENVELGSMAKKKKVKKGKSGVAEKTESSSLERLKDVSNHTLPNGPAEDEKKDRPTNEEISGENAPKTEGAKDTNEIVELGSTAKKKKVKKGKNSVAEMPDLSSVKDGKDMNNQTFQNWPAEDQNKDGPTKDGDNGENAPQGEMPKATTEIVELGSTAKKKKVKKVKNNVANEPELSSMGNKKYVETPRNSNGPAEDYNKHDSADEADKGKHITQTDKTGDFKLKTATISSQNDCQEADDVKQIGAQVLLPAEIIKSGENVEIKSDKPKKRTQKKQDVTAKDTRGMPLAEQFNEKIRDRGIPRMVDDVSSTNSDVDGATQQRELVGDNHKELNEIPAPEVSASLAEVRKLDKPRPSKQKTKKLDQPSSVDNSASGPDMITSKKSRATDSTSEDVPQLLNDDRKTENMRHISVEPLQPSLVNKPEENVEVRSDKPKKRTQRKQNVLKDPSELPKPADGDLLTNSDINDTRRDREVSLDEGHHEDSHDVPPADVSAGLAELRNLNEPRASKAAKKLDLPSSMDTSSNGANLVKLKKCKGSGTTSLGVTELHKSVVDQKHNGSTPQPSAKPPKMSKEHHADHMNSVAKVAILHNQHSSVKRSGVISASKHDGSKLTAATSVSSDTSVRRTHQVKKAKELQKKPNENHMGLRRSSLKNTGEVGNASAQSKGLLATSGTIFDSASSDDENRMEDSGSSTRTPSDNLSSSDYSEGESKGAVVTSQPESSKGGGMNNTNSNMPRLTLESMLRSSSRYRKAKLVASQSQGGESESQPVEFVPDSQADL